jgi:4'-phosphopantetheinyl transferase
VYVYFARSSALLEDASPITLLDEQERARYERFMFAHSKREFCAAHALLRTVLTRHDPTHSASEWRFTVNPWGRPQLIPSQAREDLRFNLSHTHDLVCVAISRSRELGVDVEDTLRRGQTLEIADRFFARAEVEQLQSTAIEQQIRRFFSFWTLKESYIKARGMGLAIPLEQFAFTIEGSELATHAAPPAKLLTHVTLYTDPSLNDDATRWSFQQFALTDRHMGAIAVEVMPGRSPSHEPRSQAIELQLVQVHSLSDFAGR